MSKPSRRRNWICIVDRDGFLIQGFKNVKDAKRLRDHWNVTHLHSAPYKVIRVVANRTYK